MESFHQRDLLSSLPGKILLLLNNLLPQHKAPQLAFALHFSITDLSRLKIALNGLKILEIILKLVALFLNWRLGLFKIVLGQNCGVHITFSLARLILFFLVFNNFFNSRFIPLRLLRN